MQALLEQRGKVNAISFRSGARLRTPRQRCRAREILEAAVRDTVRLDDLGLRFARSTSRRALRSKASSTSSATRLADRGAQRPPNGWACPRMPTLTYLANSIRCRRSSDSVFGGHRAGPRRAIDGDSGFRRTPEARSPERPIVLNTWAARDLGVRMPAIRCRSTTTSGKTKGALRRAAPTSASPASCPSKGRRPIAIWCPSIPGSRIPSAFRDWDPPFPIDLRRVRPVDEEYWNRYRTTPKAFISHRNRAGAVAVALRSD